MNVALGQFLVQDSGRKGYSSHAYVVWRLKHGSNERSREGGGRETRVGVEHRGGLSMNGLDGNMKAGRARRSTFEDWMAAVNTHIQRRTGLDRDDLPDWNYRDAYDDDMSPSEAAREAVRNASDGGD